MNPHEILKYSKEEHDLDGCERPTLDECREQLKRTPDSPKAWYKYAGACEAWDEAADAYIQAIKCATRICELFPDKEDACEEVVSEVIREAVDAAIFAASMLYSSEHKKIGEETIRSYYARYPHNTDVNSAMVFVFAGEGMYGEAMRAYERCDPVACERDTDDGIAASTALHLLWNFYTENAEVMARWILDRWPNNRNAQYCLISSLNVQNRHAEALDLCMGDSKDSLEGDSECLYEKAWAMISMDRLNEAKQVLIRLVELDPTYDEAQRMLDNLEKHQGQK